MMKEREDCDKVVFPYEYNEWETDLDCVVGGEDMRMRLEFLVKVDTPLEIVMGSLGEYVKKLRNRDGLDYSFSNVRQITFYTRQQLDRRAEYL